MKVKNFNKVIQMEKKPLEFKDRMTANQFNYIMSLRKKQIGRVKMNYTEMKKYLTKNAATKLIELLTDEYYDITVVLRQNYKPKKKFVDERHLQKQNNLQTTATRLDMLKTQLFILNKNNGKN